MLARRSPKLRWRARLRRSARKDRNEPPAQGPWENQPPTKRHAAAWDDDYMVEIIRQ